MPKIPRSSTRYGIEDLKAIMKQLRNPEGGCPWDLQQDFQSIAKYTIEEAYEVVDAIDNQDRGALCDELGDLLFQVIYHAEMAAEEGSFVFDDVVHGICEKLVRRHPHVFGDEALLTQDEIRDMWERIKLEEKAALIDDDAPRSLLSCVPVALPGMTRAVKLQSKAAKVGFDWPDTGPVLDKIREELDEFCEAFEDDSALAPAKQREEFGDLLFVLANLARHLKIDPETAVRDANQKFIRRFSFIETSYNHNVEALSAASLEEMDALWDEAKALETSAS